MQDDISADSDSDSPSDRDSVEPKPEPSEPTSQRSVAGEPPSAAPEDIEQSVGWIRLGRRVHSASKVFADAARPQGQVHPGTILRAIG